MVTSSCPTSKYLNRTEQPLEFGVLGFYYDLSFRIMRTVIDRADGRFAKQVSNLYYDSSSSVHVLETNVFFNITLTVVIVISLLLALSFWVASILLCGKNIVIGKRSSRTDTLVLAFSSLTICICVTSVAVYCYISSVRVIRNGHSTALVDIERAYESVNSFIADSTNTTLCLFDERRPTLEKTFTSMLINTSKKLDDLHNNFTHRDISGILASKKVLLETLRELEKLIGKSRSKELARIAAVNRKTQTVLGTFNIMQSDAEAVENFLGVLKDGLSAMANYSRNGETRMREDLDSYRLLINDVNANYLIRKAHKNIFKEVMEEIERFQVVANDVRRANVPDFTELVIEFLWVAVVPLFVQITFAVVAIGALVLRYRSEPDENHAPFGKTFFDIAGHATMIIVATLCILFAGSFITAYIAMHMCVGFTEGGDPPPLEHSDIYSSSNSSLKPQSRVDLIRSLQKCERGGSILSAVGIKHVWSNNFDELNSEIGRIGKALGSSQIDIDLFRLSFDLKGKADDFRKAVDGISGKTVSNNKQGPRIRDVANRASRELDQLLKELFNVTQDLHPLLMRRAREEFFNNIINTVSLLNLDQHSTMHDHCEHFAIHSPQCQPIVLIWTVFGPAHCQFITHPTQGLWPSFLICAVGSLFLYYGVSKASSYIKTKSAVEVKSTEQESTTGKEKLPSKKKAKLSKRKKPSKRISKRKRKTTKKKKTKSAEIVSVQSKEMSKEGSKEKQSAETDDAPEKLARQVNYDRTQEEDELPVEPGGPSKEKAAKVVPLTQMPKVPWDNYEPSQKQYSWRVYRSKGQLSPLPKELVQSIRDWKPPPVSELTPKERELANLRTQDEEEVEPPLLPLDVDIKEEPHKKEKTQSQSKDRNFSSESELIIEGVPPPKESASQGNSEIERAVQPQPP